MTIALSGRFVATIEGHGSKLLSQSVSRDENNNIGLVYTHN